jgi:hypothetical protein
MRRRKDAALGCNRQLALIFDPPDERSPETHGPRAPSTIGGVEADNKPDLERGQAAARDAGRESADGYGMVVVQLNERWRVIQCRDSQWVAQRRRNAGRRGPEWKSKHYCITREALIRDCDASCGPIGPAERAILLDLPEICGGSPQSAGQP